jgi:hypothetical protein
VRSVSRYGHVAPVRSRGDPRGPRRVPPRWGHGGMGDEGGRCPPFSSAPWLDCGLSAKGIQSYSRMWLNRCRRMNLQRRHPLCLVPARAPTGLSPMLARMQKNAQKCSSYVPQTPPPASRASLFQCSLESDNFGLVYSVT